MEYPKVEKRKKVWKGKNSTNLSNELLPRANKLVAIYRLLSLGEIDPLTKEEVIPPPAIIPSTYTLFDKFENDQNRKHKVMKSISGIEHRVGKDGKPERIEVLKDIEFSGGYLMLNTQTQYNTFLFVELHPLNTSNRFRKDYPNGGGQALFERVDKEYKNTSIKIAEADLSHDAETSIRKMEYNKVKEYSVDLGLSVLNMRPDDVKLNLRQFARNNPRKFLASHPDEKIKATLSVLDAMSLGLLEYSDDGRKFSIFNEESPFYTVTAGNEAQTDLVDYLVTEDGENDLNEINRLLLEE